MNKQYKLANKNIIFEAFDGEIVLTNFVTGIYYGFNTTASLIWTMILHGKTGHEIISSLEQAFPNNKAQLQIDLNSFINSLLTEEIIKESVDVLKNNEKIDITASSYVAPNFDRFDDMKEMLMTDVIHEVENDGWPNKK